MAYVTLLTLRLILITKLMPTINQTSEHILDVDKLRVSFKVYGGTVQAVRGVSYTVNKGETLAVVGESGCGKSVTAASIMGLTQETQGCEVSGSIRFRGEELIGTSKKRLNALRGAGMAMIFQDPMSSLNPTMPVGKQIGEVLRLHRGMNSHDARQESIRLLDRTQIPEAQQRAAQYPFEFSGGMLQRVMIAMALAGRPKLLIADEPTTALDLTIQDQVLHLMREIQQEEGMALILITHDLGVVARMANTVAVMYAGNIVETASVEALFDNTQHPYTADLLKAMPNINQQRQERLNAITGSPPDLFSPPKGCGYFDRCSQAMHICKRQPPPDLMATDTHLTRCWQLHPDKPNA